MNRRCAKRGPVQPPAPSLAVTEGGPRCRACGNCPAWSATRAAPRPPSARRWRSSNTGGGARRPATQRPSRSVRPWPDEGGLRMSGGRSRRNAHVASRRAWSTCRPSHGASTTRASRAKRGITRLGSSTRRRLKMPSMNGGIDYGAARKGAMPRPHSRSGWCGIGDTHQPSAWRCLACLNAGEKRLDPIRRPGRAAAPTPHHRWRICTARDCIRSRDNRHLLKPELTVS